MVPDPCFQKSRLLRALAVAAVLALAACETTKGIGRDVENAGQALDDVF